MSPVTLALIMWFLIAVAAMLVLLIWLVADDNLRRNKRGAR